MLRTWLLIGRIFSAVMFGALVPQALTAECSSHNLLRNPGFEDAGWQSIASGWKDNSGWADVDVDYSYLENSGRDGGKAQKIRIGAVRRGAAQFVQPGIKLRKGHIYQLSVWMKGGLSMPIEVLLRKRGRPYTMYAADAFAISGQWKKYVFRDVVTENDANAYFMLRTKGTGSILLDDARLVDVTSCNVQDIPPDGNLIVNGGFEVGLGRWSVLTRANSGYQYMAKVRWEAAEPDVASDYSKNGRHSLKIQVPEDGKVRISSPYINISSNKELILSFYIRSREPRRLRYGVVAGDYGKSHGVIKNIRVKTGWSRVSLKGRLPPARGNSYVVFIESDDPGTFWLDSVQLLEANRTENSVPGMPAEAGFGNTGRSFLFLRGDSAPLPLNVYMPGKKNVRVELSKYDWRGSRQSVATREIQLDEDGYGQLVEYIDTGNTGYWRMVARVISAGERAVVTEQAVGVVPEHATASPNSAFGNHAWFSPVGLERARMIGAGWLRLHPPNATKWAIVEPEKGEYRFYDQSLLAAKRMGFNLLGSLDATPAWASGTDSTNFHEYRTKPPLHVQAWERYVHTTVAHYRGVVDHWEVWNEPDSNSFLNVGRNAGIEAKAEMYTQLLKVAYKAAKRANPDAVIIGGCPTGSNPVKWIRAIARHGALDYLDAISFHRYTDGRPGGMMDIPTHDIVDSFNTIMEKHGLSPMKPVWETESGARFVESGYQYFKDVNSGYSIDPAQAAAYIVRNQIHLLEGGVKRWFYYGATASKRADRTDFTGLFEWDGSPRMTAVAYAVMSNTLAHLSYMEGFDLQGTHLSRFTGPSEIVDVVWTKTWMSGESKQAHLQPPGGCRSYEVRDIMGSLVKSGEPRGAVKVLAEEVPKYIEWHQCNDTFSTGSTAGPS